MSNNIYDKPNALCTGCGACSVTCPHGAIDMSMSASGFLEAVIADDKCTG